MTPSNYTSLSFVDQGAANNLPPSNEPDSYLVTAINSYGSASTEPINVSVAQTNVSSSPWSGVVYVNSSVTVPSNLDLTIEPGTKIIFNAGGAYSLTTNSPLSVNGTSSTPVTFTSNSSSPSPGDWESIILNGSGANGSTINYAKVAFSTEIPSFFGGIDDQVTSASLIGNFEARLV